MATVSKEIAEQIIANNGHYDDDPIVYRITKYTNAWGDEAYGLEYERELPLNRYQETEFVRHPEVIFEYCPHVRKIRQQGQEHTFYCNDCKKYFSDKEQINEKQN